MQFKKAVEDHRGGHSVLEEEEATLPSCSVKWVEEEEGESKGYLYRKKDGEREEPRGGGGGGDW